MSVYRICTQCILDACSTSALSKYLEIADELRCEASVMRCKQKANKAVTAE